MTPSHRVRSALLSLGGSPELRVAAVIVLLGALMTSASPYFLVLANVLDVLESVAVISVVACGVTFVLLVGAIDVSVGSTMGVAAMVTGFLHLAHAPIGVAMVAGVAAGVVIGVINGTLVVYLRFPDLIATLAMLSVLRGIIYLFVGQTPLRGYHSELYFFLTRGKVLAVIPILLVITCLVVWCAWVVLTRTRHGRQIVLSGTNAQAAMVAGINVKKVKFGMFVTCGGLAGIAGVLLGGRLGGAYPQIAEGYELTAIAAAVIGGTSLAGGKGSVGGALLGAILLGLINNILTLLAINPFWQRIVTGLIILLAVVIDTQLSAWIRRTELARAREAASGELDRGPSR